MDIRSTLFDDGITMLLDTYGRGIGAGNFESFQTKHFFSDTPLPDPHNLWLEVFSQYGILVGFFFVYWLIKCIRTLMRARRMALAANDQRLRTEDAHQGCAPDFCRSLDQKASNRQTSRIRARIEHDFGSCVSP